MGAVKLGEVRQPGNPFLLSRLVAAINRNQVGSAAAVETFDAQSLGSLQMSHGPLEFFVTSQATAFWPIFE